MSKTKTTYCIESRAQGSAKPILTVALDRNGDLLFAMNPPVLKQLNARDAKDIADRILEEILKHARPVTLSSNVPSAGNADRMATSA